MNCFIAAALGGITNAAGVASPVPGVGSTSPRGVALLSTGVGSAGGVGAMMGEGLGAGPTGPTGYPGTGSLGAWPRALAGSFFSSAVAEDPGLPEHVFPLNVSQSRQLLSPVHPAQSSVRMASLCAQRRRGFVASMPHPYLAYDVTDPARFIGKFGRESSVDRL